jgi:hypothetical protein
VSEQANRAKDALLLALECIDRAEEIIGGDAERVDVLIVYAVGRVNDGKWRSCDGWSSTASPSDTLADMAQRAAVDIQMALASSVKRHEDDDPTDADLDDPPAP